MTWSTSCPDWESRIIAGESLITFPPLFPQEAAAALSQFKELRLVDVLNRPTLGEAGRPWLFDFVSAIFGAYDHEEGRRLISEFFLLISKKNSKALALDTPIPTPGGWTTIKDVHPGDIIFGADGKPCRVVAESEIFTDHECYRIEFSNGETVTADAGHLWKTNALADGPGIGKGNHGDTKQRRRRVRTTREIANTLFRPGDNARNHSLSMPTPIECNEAELPIAPYTLGAWLGDGHSAAGKITCHKDDTEILDGIKADGWPVRYASNNGSAANTYALTDGSLSQAARNVCLAARLRKIGVLENKHIPEIYMRASLRQRLALLQGLMDTDGSINKNGRVLVFSGMNRRLVLGLSELLSTFGIKNTFTERKVKCNGKPAGVAYFVQFMAFRDVLPVFRLRRKLNRMRLSDEAGAINRSQTVQIVNAEAVPSTPVKCITVDSQDHQFLFGRTMLPTHNSTSASAIMLTALIRNWRESAEFTILAPTVEVANNSFLPARDMVRADPELDDLMHVQDHLRQITHRQTGATLKVVAADSETVGGKKATGVLVDELWLFGKRANAENMLREACGGLASRPEGFVIYLSTQSDEAPAGVFKQKLDYARGVRDGKIDDKKFLPVIYEYPAALAKEKKYLERKYWYITNPNLGASVDEEFLVHEFKKAEEAGSASMAGYLAKHHNVEMGMNLKTQRWAGADFWEAAAGKVTLDLILERCEVVVVGGDGGGLDDLLGMAVMGRDGENWMLWTHAWCHPIALERRKSEAPRYRDFERDGDLTIVNEIGQDVKEFGDIVRRFESAGVLDRIGVDPVGIGAIVDELEHGDEKGELAIANDRIVGIPQGWRLSGAIKTTERKIAEKSLIHGGQPLMAWCVGNARVEPRGNAVIITKQASGTGKIDPLMATFNAVALMAMNPEARKKRSAYDGLSVEEMVKRMKGE